MSGNSTSNTTSEIPYDLVVKFGFYMALGFVLMVTNMLIVAVVMWFKVLRERKEFIIMAALAFVDGLNGTAAVIAGVQRSAIILSGNAVTLVSRWECFTRLHNLIWNFSDKAAPVMLLVVAIDRLIAVSFPVRYFKFTARYAWTFVACVFALHAIEGLAAGVTVYQYQFPEKPAVCMSSYGFTKFFSDLKFYIQCFSVMFCIPVYVAVFVMFNIKQGGVWPEGSAAHETFLKLQRRLVVTLAVSSIFSLLFYEIPTLLIFLEWAADLPALDFGSLSPALYALSLLNPILNLFIYAIRHKEIRLGIKSMLQCKKLSDSHLN